MSTVETKERGNRKERTGLVVSDVQNKTIVIEVTRRTTHPRYKKVIKVKKKYTAQLIGLLTGKKAKEELKKREFLTGMEFRGI